MKGKRIIACALAFVMTISLLGMNSQVINATTNTTTTTPDWLVPRQMDRDVVISVTDNATVSLNTVKSELGNLVSQAGQTQTNINTANINVADLSNWYVYDHYDTNVYKDKAAYLAGTGYNETLRPYFSCADSSAASWSGVAGVTSPVDYTIENAKAANNDSVTARHLKEHIVAGIDATGATNIYWYGYSDIAGTDWAFYPAAAGGKKTVDYKVDASKIYFHTVPSTAGTGFLFNTKIQNGKIYGYAVMTNYTASGSYPSGIAGFTIYKINGANADSVHQSQISSYSGNWREVASKTVSGLTIAAGYDRSQIHMEITDTNLIMTVTPIGENAGQGANATEIFNDTLDNICNNNYEDYSAGGFGPIVSYSSHGCATTSAVDFTDLKMKLTDSDTVLNGYENADYTQFDENKNASKKYYVLLGNNTNTDESGNVDFFNLEADAPFLEMLKAENVVLVTNLEIEKQTVQDGMNGTNYNLADHLGSGNVIQIKPDSSSEADIAQAVYTAINQNEFNVTNATNATNALGTSSTSSGTNVYVTESTSGCQVGTISAGRSSYNGATLNVNTDLSVNTNSIVVKVLDPNGDELRATATQGGNTATYSNRTITLPKNALTGIYTVKVTDTLGGNKNIAKTVASSTSFEVTKNLNLTFNGGTNKSGTDTDGCSTNNILGTGVVNAAGAFSFTVTLDAADSPLTVYGITWGPNGTENKLVENTDYNVVKNGNVYTFTISADKMATIQDAINVQAMCSNVFDEMEYAEIKDAQTNGNVISTCVPGQSFIVYLSVDEKYFHPLKAEDFKVYSESDLLVYQENYMFDSTTGKIYIYDDSVGNTLRFVGEPQPVVFQVATELDDELTFTGEETANFAAEYIATLSAQEHHTVDTIKVITDNPNHSVLTDGIDYTFERATGTLKINKNHVFGNVTVKATAKTATYTVTNELENLSTDSSNTVQVDYLNQYKETLSATSPYHLPETILVTRGDLNERLVEGIDYTYNKSTGRINLFASAMTDNITIKAYGDNTNVYSKIDNVKVMNQESGGTEVKVHGITSDFIAYLVADDNYNRPTVDQFKIYVDDNEMILNTDYTYASATGKVRIQKALVDSATNKIYFVGATSAKQFNVVKQVSDGIEYTGETGEKVVTYGVDYEAEVKALIDYMLPTTITVKVNNVALESSQYVYNVNTGKISISGDKITGDINIIVDAVENKQAAPAVTAGKRASSETATDGTINGIDANMEISTDGVQYTSVLDATVTYAPGTYYVRYPANDLQSASLATTVTVLAKETQAAPIVSADKRASSEIATDGTIRGIDTSMEYSKDGGKTYEAVTEGMTFKAGEYLFRYPETEEKQVSGTTKVTVLAKESQEAPKVSAEKRASSETATDGTIKGIDTSMEYSKDGGQTYEAVTEGMTFKAGEYLFRYPETADKKASEPVKVTVKVKETQQAPAVEAGNGTTSEETADGTIKGIDPSMEYSKDGGQTYEPVTEGMTFGPGEYLFRYPETADKKASEAVKVTVKVKETQKTPDIEIGNGTTSEEATDGTIKGIDPSMEYSKDGGQTYEPVTEGMTFGPGEYLFRYPETADKKASEAVKVIIKVKEIQKAPLVEVEEGATSEEGTDGIIKGIDSSMEYSKDGGKTYEPVTEGMTFGPGEYLFRYPETADKKASEATKVTVLIKKFLTVDEKGYTGIYDGMSHGITVTSSVTGTEFYYSETPLDKDNYLTVGKTSSPVFTDVCNESIYYYAVLDGYEPASGSVTVTISKKPVEVSPLDQIIIAGNEITANAVSYNGFIGEDNKDNQALDTMAVVGVAEGDITQPGTGKLKISDLGALKPEYAKNYVLKNTDLTANLLIVEKQEGNTDTSIKVTENSGIIETDTIKEEGLPETKISNLTVETAKGLLTPEEMQKIEQGEDALIYLEMTDAADIADETEKSGILAKAEENGTPEIGAWIDLSLYKKVGSALAEKITSTGETTIEVAVTLPEELLLKDAEKIRTYSIIRMHDGMAEVLPMTLENGVLKFDTDRFSLYAIAYRDGDATKVTGVTVDKNETVMNKIGDTVQLTVNVEPKDAGNKKIIWTSSDPKVATVDETGKVTALAEGTAVITATTEDGSFTATCKVTVKASATENTESTENTDAETVSAKQQEKNELALNAGLKVSQTGSKINVTWGEVKDAEGYDVYVQYCGKKFTSKSINSVNSGKVTKIVITKVNGKKLDLKKNFKVYVRAYKKLENGKKVTLGKTITAHIVGRKNTGSTNVKEVKVSKSSYTLKVGKSATIKAKTVLVDKKKKQLSNAHAKQFRYASSDKKVATVSSKGKITAVSKGSCVVYVYARNGYAKKVKVTVK